MRPAHAARSLRGRCPRSPLRNPRAAPRTGQAKRLAPRGPLSAVRGGLLELAAAVPTGADLRSWAGAPASPRQGVPKNVPYPRGLEDGRRAPRRLFLPAATTAAGRRARKGSLRQRRPLRPPRGRLPSSARRLPRSNSTTGRGRGPVDTSKGDHGVPRRSWAEPYASSAELRRRQAAPVEG